MATGFGFNDKSLCLSPPARLVIIGSEQCGVRGKEEGLRDVAVVFWVVILHFDHVFGKVIFARERVHAGKMVDFLVGLQLAEQLASDGGVGPPEVPVLEVLFDDDVIV